MTRRVGVSHAETLLADQVAKAQEVAAIELERLRKVAQGRAPHEEPPAASPAASPPAAPAPPAKAARGATSQPPPAKSRRSGATSRQAPAAPATATGPRAGTPRAGRAAPSGGPAAPAIPPGHLLLNPDEVAALDALLASHPTFPGPTKSGTTGGKAAPPSGSRRGQSTATGQSQSFAGTGRKARR